MDGTRILELSCVGETTVGKGDRLVFTDPRGKLQETIVVSPEHRREDTRIVTSLVCKGSLSELDDTFIEDKRNRNATATECLRKALENTRWSVGTVDDVGALADLSFYHVSALQAVESIADKFGLEVTSSYLMDPEHLRITDRAVNLVKAQGDQTGEGLRRFEYGHNLKGITRTVDATGVKTRLYGYGKGLAATDGEGNETGGYGRRIDFSEVNGGKPYVEDPAATKLWGVPGPLVETQGKNLLKNNGFERPYADGWLFSPTTAFLDAIIKQDGSVRPHEGSRMLRMGSDPDTSASKAITDFAKVKGNTLYELAFWTHGPQGSSFGITVTQNVNVYPTSNITLSGPTNNGGWKRTTRRFTTHRLCSSVDVRITNPTTVMYLDDVELHEVSATTIHPTEGMYENPECEDKAQLLAETRAELTRRSVPTVCYEADVLTLAQTGMDTKNVGLGDRVLLVDTTFTPALRLTGRVLQLEEDLLHPAMTTVTIGNIIQRLTASNRSAEQRLDRVVAESAAWSTSSQRISQNASKWDQVAQTVVDNAPQWNSTAQTVTDKAGEWDAAASTVSAKHTNWDATAASLGEGKPRWDETATTVESNGDAWNQTSQAVETGKPAWDEAAATVNGLAQSVQRSEASTTVAHGDLAITLGEHIALTDPTGTYVFTEGAFVKQEPEPSE